MGMVAIEMWGSFPARKFSACAEAGGHVMAIKRSIEFLTSQLGDAVVKDVELTKDGIVPPKAPLGKDSVESEPLPATGATHAKATLSQLDRALVLAVGELSWHRADDHPGDLYQQLLAEAKGPAHAIEVVEEAGWMMADIRFLGMCDDVQRAKASLAEAMVEIKRLQAMLDERTLQHKTQHDNALRLQRERDDKEAEIQRLWTLHKAAKKVIDDPRD